MRTSTFFVSLPFTQTPGLSSSLALVLCLSGPWTGPTCLLWDMTYWMAHFSLTGMLALLSWGSRYWGPHLCLDSTT